ncbi:hypothetical protein BDZ91DRAFT_94507 [Kalaharituber pfeilii]|nr:hypothetical protein BDZ91DRAFT_94507 [Kalaharituber pfeilii]
MLATTPNPAAIPLPPSQVDSPTIVGSHSLGEVESPLSATLINASIEPGHKDTHLTPGNYPQGIGTADDTREKMDDNPERAQPSGGLSPLPSGQTINTGAKAKPLSAGTAASIAVREHRPVQAWSPATSGSAGLAATRAVREHKPVQVQKVEAASFANTAAVLAHEATIPAARAADTAASADHPTPLTDAVRHGAPIPPSLQQDRSLGGLKIASSTINQQQASGTPDRKRTFNPHLEEAAREAAARRLALLDQELAEAGYLRRASIPNTMSKIRGDRAQHSPNPSGKSRTMKDRSSTVSTAAGLKQIAAEDYGNLMAIAQRNVKNRMAGIDSQIAERTGLVYRHNWSEKALQLAEERAQSNSRSENKGKIDIGGGKFIDPEVVDAIAFKNVKPVLDDLTAKAEAERARIAAERQEMEERKRAEALEKERNREARKEMKKVKATEKTEHLRRKEEEKQEKRRSKAEVQTSPPRATIDSDDSRRQASKTEVPPAAEPKFKLRKLIGRIRASSLNSSSPPPASPERERQSGATVIPPQQITSGTEASAQKLPEQNGVNGESSGIYADRPLRRHYMPIREIAVDKSETMEPGNDDAGGSDQSIPRTGGSELHMPSRSPANTSTVSLSSQPIDGMEEHTLRGANKEKYGTAAAPRKSEPSASSYTTAPESGTGISAGTETEVSTGREMDSRFREEK